MMSKIFPATIFALVLLTLYYFGNPFIVYDDEDYNYFDPTSPKHVRAIEFRRPLAENKDLPKAGLHMGWIFEFATQEKKYRYCIRQVLQERNRCR